MTCEICGEREAVHVIRGRDVCADQRCKYLAWEKESDGEVTEEKEC